MFEQLFVLMLLLQLLAKTAVYSLFDDWLLCEGLEAWHERHHSE